MNHLHIENEKEYEKISETSATRKIEFRFCSTVSLLYYLKIVWISHQIMAFGNNTNIIHRHKDHTEHVPIDEEYIYIYFGQETAQRGKNHSGKRRKEKIYKLIYNPLR